jgi:hypothetical protein
MRATLAALLIPAVALATTTVMPPAKEKTSLLGTWDGLDLSDESAVVYRMVLLPGDDGYLVWPNQHDEEALEAARFLGRLVKLEFKEGHVKLLFKRLPNQTNLTRSRYDSIEIEGEVVSAEDMEEATRVAEIRGTATVRLEENGDPQIRPMRMARPAGSVERWARRLTAEARRAENLLAQEVKPGPQGSREDALAILREQEVIRSDTRVVSAEWSEKSREWRIELVQFGGRTVTIGVNVPAHNFHYLDNPSK